MIKLVQNPGGVGYTDPESGLFYTNLQAAALVGQGQAMVVDAIPGMGYAVPTKEAPVAEPSFWEKHKGKVFVGLGLYLAYKFLPKK